MLGVFRCNLDFLRPLNFILSYSFLFSHSFVYIISFTDRSDMRTEEQINLKFLIPVGENSITNS